MAKKLGLLDIGAHYDKYGDIKHTKKSINVLTLAGEFNRGVFGRIGHGAEKALREYIAAYPRKFKYIDPDVVLTIAAQLRECDEMIERGSV